jgi:hypothetical protein
LESIKEVYKELEPILIPIWNVFKEVVKGVLDIIVERIKSSFQSIGDCIK